MRVPVGKRPESCYSYHMASKRTVPSGSTVSVLVGAAIFTLALSLAFIGWYLVYPYTVLVIFLILGSIIGTLLRTLNTPNSFAVSFIGCAFSYALIIFVRLFPGVDVYGLGSIAIMSLIGFSAALALTKTIETLESMVVLTIILCVGSLFTPELYTQINHLLYLH